jgi:ribosomal 50S subunit-recycling heat shock protein
VKLRAHGVNPYCGLWTANFFRSCCTMPKETMTLDRVLSRFGLASRTEAREAVRAGRLKVNGRVVRDPDCWVRLEREAGAQNLSALLQAQRRDHQSRRPGQSQDSLRLPR